MVKIMLGEHDLGEHDLGKHERSLVSMKHGENNAG